MCYSFIFCGQVFLKYFHVEQLNIAVTAFARRITTCQKYVRRFTAQRRYENMKETARKCEEDMKQLNDVVRQMTDYLKPLQKKLQDEDAKQQKEILRAEEQRREEEEKRKAEAEQKRRLEEQQKQQENKTVSLIITIIIPVGTGTLFAFMLVIKN